MTYSKPSDAPKLNDISCKSVDLPDILQCDHSSGTSLPVLLVINNKVLFFFQYFTGISKKFAHLQFCLPVTLDSV